MTRAEAVGAYVRSIRNERKRAYAIAYLAHLVEGGPEPLPDSSATSWPTHGRIREAINDAMRPEAPKPEPASGVAGWTECAEHGWVREPHFHAPAPVPNRKRRIGPLRYSCGICHSTGPKFHAHEKGPPLLKRSQLLTWLQQNASDVADVDEFEVYSAATFCYRFRVRCWDSIQVNTANVTGEEPRFENCKLKVGHEGGHDTTAGITQAAA